ncbi:efflux RND transporter periplasmic adaptor subunit [Roseomonas gilardii]|uniref:efflux RND transporter periplasmic adaptor subunit n=1 Tax=Roseomonas gilardii TaxID=257708 RepID=UPI0004890861|nr:efflux RND transporter periplasmic adaptor subunit [Roseomonas gilardii]SUE63059.1 Acriflavine resistance protein A precursor [Roseomonas gilardii subsp. rosea]
MTRSSFSRLVVLIVLLAGLGGGGYWAWKHYLGGAAQDGATAARSGRPAGGPGGARRPGPGGPGGGAPVPVTAAAAEAKDLPLTIDALGTVTPLNTITVRSQVSGTLVEVAFREGQEVRKGDLLARIDDRTYVAALEQAKAKKAYDQAQLANAKVDLQRYQGLLAANGVTRQQVDTQRAQVAMYEAQVAQDQAAIDSAQTQVDFTVIRAPIDGRVGLRQVDPGNLVQTSDSSGLVTLTQMRPITAIFTIPQQELGRLLRAQAAGKVPVRTIAAGDDPGAAGTLLTVDNQVDSATGTVRARAVFPNEDSHLWPGAFVNLRIGIETVPDATVVPLVSVQQGPDGAFVFVVGADSKVEQRPVQLGAVTLTEAVIRQGLKPGERVVTSGALRLSPGATVSVVDPPAPAREAPAAPTASRQGRRQAEAGVQGGSRTGSPAGASN